MSARAKRIETYLNSMQTAHLTGERSFVTDVGNFKKKTLHIKFLDVINIVLFMQTCDLMSTVKHNIFNSIGTDHDIEK